jgi:hypothetical protein
VKAYTSEGSFRLAVHICLDKDGNLTGTVDSLDEDMNGMPVQRQTQSYVLKF